MSTDLQSEFDKLKGHFDTTCERNALLHSALCEMVVLEKGECPPFLDVMMVRFREILKRAATMQPRAADVHQLEFLILRALAAIQVLRPLVEPQWAKNGLAEATADLTQACELLRGEKA